MGLYRSVRAVADSDAAGAIDWDAVAEAAKAATTPGDLPRSAAEQRAYADDVRAARDRVREVADTEFDLPDRVEVQNRHHWIDAALPTFRRLLAPAENREASGLSRLLNTGATAASVAYLASNVLGQYDPLLLSEEPHALYFVHPNVVRVAEDLDAPLDRFRRWIAFHEVTHAAEFAAAPWLTDHLEADLRDALAGSETLDPAALVEVNRTMTVVEGYAELLMDRAFDRDAADLRAKLDEARRGNGVLSRFLRRALGLDLKRQQYERGRAFFEAVVDAEGMAAAGRVWDDPASLPSEAELDDPERWLARVVQ